MKNKSPIDLDLFFDDQVLKSGVNNKLGFSGCTALNLIKIITVRPWFIDQGIRSCSKLIDCKCQLKADALPFSIFSDEIFQNSLA